MRNVIAAVLLVVALLSGLVGAGLHWIHRAAYTPEPTAALVKAIATDNTFISAVTEQLVRSLEEHVPDIVSSVPGAHEVLTDAFQAGITATIENPDVAAVWQQMLSDSRTRLVADIETFGLRGGTPPSVTLNLSPVMTAVWDAVISGNPVAALLLSDVRPPDELMVHVANVPPSEAATASGILQAASFWWLLYVVAAALLVGGLVVGTGLARWVLLAVIALVGLGAIYGLRLILDAVSYPTTDNSVVSALGNSTVRLLGQSLADWFTWLWYGCLGALGLGCAGAIIGRVRRA